MAERILQTWNNGWHTHKNGTRNISFFKAKLVSNGAEDVMKEERTSFSIDKNGVMYISQESCEYHDKEVRQNPKVQRFNYKASNRKHSSQYFSEEEVREIAKLFT